MRCDEVSELFPQILEGEESADSRLISHVESCLQCRAELVQYRKLLRLVHQLRDQGLKPPSGLLGEILTAVEEVAERGAIRSMLKGRRLAYVGGLAVAAGAAGVAGAAVVMVNRGRRVRQPSVGHVGISPSASTLRQAS